MLESTTGQLAVTKISESGGEQRDKKGRLEPRGAPEKEASG